MKQALAFALTAIITGGQAAQDAEPKKPVADASYFPMKIGISRTYHLVHVDTVREHYIRGQDIDSGNWMCDDCSESKEVGATEHYKVEKDGVYLAKFVKGGKEWKPSDPVRLLPFDIPEGGGWGQWLTWNGGPKMCYSGEVVGEEKVKVPLGEYTALKVRVTSYIDTSGLNEVPPAVVDIVERWFVKDIGPVKIVQTRKAGGKEKVVYHAELAEFKRDKDR
jgi:hypothetical protein